MQRTSLLLPHQEAALAVWKKTKSPSVQSHPHSHKPTPDATGQALLLALLLPLRRLLLSAAGLALPAVPLPGWSGSGLPAPRAASDCCAASLSTWLSQHTSTNSKHL
jgi:hypothetical protein